jgi:hypothetical protein
MKPTHLFVLAALAIAAPAISQAQVAGSTFLGSSYTEMRDVAIGWSAKRQILGHPVYNDLNERRIDRRRHCHDRQVGVVRDHQCRRLSRREQA